MLCYDNTYTADATSLLWILHNGTVSLKFQLEKNQVLETDCWGKSKSFLLSHFIIALTLATKPFNNFKYDKQN